MVQTPVENPYLITKGLSRHASNIQINVFLLYEEVPSVKEIQTITRYNGLCFIT